ncbi:MerR family transcriptional regulator [Agrococcus jenensis]|uniref:DNA-binding transcriptional MerR regulator n=1 Tax=Agrococcus jenensis TaxID=46353 RepID=A0A3N2AQL0_9MICO|nr:MerR family transcriptional regulator [Agrococcus jenensis]ROR65331.1 DNA-binding transcriptional MerR regulator [Agrococcus jenensis]
MMHIGELAERVGLSLRSLRHWDDVGLVHASGRTDGGFRLYTEADEERVRLIMRMKPFGFSLEELAELADAIEGSPADPLAALPAERAEWFRTQMHERRAKLARQLADADALLARVGPFTPPAD